MSAATLEEKLAQALGGCSLARRRAAAAERERDQNARKLAAARDEIRRLQSDLAAANARIVEQNQLIRALRGTPIDAFYQTPGE